MIPLFPSRDPRKERQQLVKPPSICDFPSSHHEALATGWWLAWILRFLNFRNHELEGLLNVLVVSCTSLGESAFEFVPQFLSLFKRHLS